MKSKGEVLHKIRQVRFRHIKKAIRKGLARHPHNCSYNKETEIHPFRVRVCSHPDMLSGSELPICDSRLGDLSPNCDKFCAKHCKEDIKDQVKSLLNSPELGEVAYHYPDVAALVWVLDSDDMADFQDLDDEDQPPDAEEVDLPLIPLTPIQQSGHFSEWWARIRQWWMSLF